MGSSSELVQRRRQVMWYCVGALHAAPMLRLDSRVKMSHGRFPLPVEEG